MRRCQRLPDVTHPVDSDATDREHIKSHARDFSEKWPRFAEAAPPPSGATPDIGQIALACALGYRDFRFPGTWRADHPRLVAWLDEFARRVPAFAATKPPG